MTKQPEALRLADAIYEKASKEADRRNSAYDYFGMDNTPESVDPNGTEAAALLRSQHAEIEALKAERVPLTDEQIAEIWSRNRPNGTAFARAIEAAHGIGEKK